MKFRRKAQSDAVEDDGTVDERRVEDGAADAEDLRRDGPFDSEVDAAEDDVERVDLGRLLVTPSRASSSGSRSTRPTGQVQSR